MCPTADRAVFAVTADMGEAQDVVSETFVRAWDSRRSLATVDHPHAWLRTVAMRLAVSRWRRARSAATAWRRHGAIPDQAELSGDNVALVAALRQLPEAQRVAIVLHYLYDLPVAQVAEETASSVGAVKTRLSRARTALAFLLNPTADPEDSRV